MLTDYMPKSAAKMAASLMRRYGLLTNRWSDDYGVAWLLFGASPTEKSL